MPLKGPEGTLETYPTSGDPFRSPPAPPAPPGAGVSWWIQILVFIVGALVVISRRPDAITIPQFFAEDGAVWFADAYRFGLWHTLALPDAGYLQTFPRLIAGLATFVPLLYAPLLMNLVGIAAQVLPVNLLASKRLATLGGLTFRLLLGVVYLALPNSRELDVVVTNAQWHLALVACLLVVAIPPRRMRGRVADVLALLLSGLTGPFCILLLPLNAALWWFRRQRWQMVTVAVLAICGFLQAIVMSQADPAIRHSAPLGASLQSFLAIFSNHVVLAAILGSVDFTAKYRFATLALVAVGGAAVIVWVAIKANWEFRIVILFCLLIFAATLRSPLVSKTQPQWQVLAVAYGIRYWFFPMLAFVWSLVWIALSRSNSLLRLGACALLALSVRGIANDWLYPAFPNTHYPTYVTKFAGLEPGESLTVPLYPDTWSMQLVKPTSCGVRAFGVIDVPVSGQQISGPMTAVGWVYATAPVQDVQLFVDNISEGKAVPALRRTDVDALYPESPNRWKGWQAAIDVSKLAAGSHQLTAKADLGGSCTAVLGSRPFQIVK